MFDTKDAVVLKAELAGMKPDDIQIEVDDNVLTIKGERKFEEKVDEERYYRVERRFGTFQRSLALPQGVKADEIEATYEDGILEVTVPKAEEEKPKRIEVKARKTVEAKSGRELTTRTAGAESQRAAHEAGGGAATTPGREPDRADGPPRQDTTGRARRHDRQEERPADDGKREAATPKAAEPAPRPPPEAEALAGAARPWRRARQAAPPSATQYLDHLQRLKAEFENYRKRVQRDNEAHRAARRRGRRRVAAAGHRQHGPRARGRRAARGGPADRRRRARRRPAARARSRATASTRCRPSPGRPSTPTSTRRS